MLSIERMQPEHLDGVFLVENECFSIPWSKKSFQDELIKNKFSIYYVAIDDEKIIGFGGMWHIVNEGHITNIAVSEEYRNKNIGSKILEALIQKAEELEMIGLTLEVRRSNIPAQNLYKKYGFKFEGIRKEYYEDNKEDAYIMWKYLVDEDIIT